MSFFISMVHITHQSKTKELKTLLGNVTNQRNKSSQKLLMKTSTSTFEF